MRPNQGEWFGGYSRHCFCLGIVAVIVLYIVFNMFVKWRQITTRAPPHIPGIYVQDGDVQKLGCKQVLPTGCITGMEPHSLRRPHRPRLFVAYCWPFFIGRRPNNSDIRSRTSCAALLGVGRQSGMLTEGEQDFGVVARISESTSQILSTIWQQMTNAAS